MIVLGGSAGSHIGFELARLLGVGYSDIVVKEFPDGELYVKIPVDVKGESVIYINSLARRPNDLLIETILTLETLADLGARAIHAVLAYLPYARQDSRFSPGEAVSATIVGRLIRGLKVDKIYTFDLHLHRINRPEEIFGPGLVNLTAIRDLARYLREEDGVEDCVVVGPDEESEQWARIASEELGGAPYTVMEKRRISPTEVSVVPRDPEVVRGRDVVVVDDMISTGGTIAETVKALRPYGPRNVYVAVTHALLTGGAYGRLIQLGLKDMVASDTVLSPISKVHVAPILARHLRV